MLKGLGNVLELVLDVAEGLRRAFCGGSSFGLCYPKGVAHGAEIGRAAFSGRMLAHRGQCR